MFSSRKIFSGIAAAAATAGILSLTSGGTPQVRAAAVPESMMQAGQIVLTANVSPAVRDSYRIYTVRSGDTLAGISRKEYGSARCWPGIWSANIARIPNPNIIYYGETIVIPSRCSTRGPGGHRYKPPPPPPPQGGFYNGVLSFGQLEALWVDGGGPAWAEWRAARIAECESGGNRFAYNPSGATGLWQILGQVTDFGRSLTDPWVNVANAVAKFRASGDTFAQWVCQA
jgi:hypothetical protein